MNQQMFVIAVAIVAVVLSTVLAMMAQRRELEPGKKRLLWLTLAVGVAVLVAVSVRVLSAGASP